MTTQKKTLLPSSELCEACKWKQDRYGSFNLEDLKYRNNTSRELENEHYVKKKTCRNCDIEIPSERILERKKSIDSESENVKISRGKIFKSKLSWLIISIIIIIVAVLLISWFRFSLLKVPLRLFSDANSKVNILNHELSKLKLKYPNQNPELWHNVIKITNYTRPLVQVLILLYKENSKVAECFARDLVPLINMITNKNGMAVYKENSKVTDYGEELQHYLNLVRKHNHLIVLQLHRMPGNRARMFHALCDEAPSSIRPSFFIFTVEDGTTGTMDVTRPLTRAGRVLRSAWSNLMENELYPLISRVVRNVAQISPENISC